MNETNEGKGLIKLKEGEAELLENIFQKMYGHSPIPEELSQALENIKDGKLGRNDKISRGEVSIMIILQMTKEIGEDLEELEKESPGI